MSSLRATLAVVVVSLACGVASARADEHVAFTSGDGPIAAAGGTLAFSAPGADGRFVLMLATAGGAPAPAPGVAPGAAPFDVALGRSGGRLVATYSRGRRAYVYDVAAHRERRMRAIAGAASFPVVDGDRVAWVVPGRAGFTGCDRLAVRTGAGRARLVSRACRKLADLQLRGRDLVWSSTDYAGTDAHGAGAKSSSIKTYHFGGRVTTIDTTSFGEESNLLRSPVIAGRDVVYTQSGLHPRPSFVRARLTSGHIGRPRRGSAPPRVPAGTALTGPIAVDGPRAYYVIAGHGEEGCGPDEQLAPVPCELVAAATADLAAGRTRELPPELSVGYTPVTRPPAGSPLTIAGALTRRTVRDGATVATQGIAGAVVDVLARSDDTTGRASSLETFTPTGAAATTAADGTYSTTVPAPTGQPFFTAQVRVTGLLAGRGTVGYCPSGSTAQPGGGCSVPAR